MYQIQPLAFIQSLFQEKFAVPRQGNFVTELESRILLQGRYNSLDAVRGLAEFSHLWLIGVFHHNLREEHSLLVRPPKLGGNQKVGVFASRATHRPNNLSLSLVKLKRIEVKDNQVILVICGCDLVDGTPIVDIKPYLEFADQPREAVKQGYVSQVLANEQVAEPIAVDFTLLKQSKAEQYALLSQQQTALQQQGWQIADLEAMIKQLIQAAPQPGYQSLTANPREYGMSFAGINVRWGYREADSNLKIKAEIREIRLL